jgi:hypothetical protein
MGVTNADQVSGVTIWFPFGFLLSIYPWPLSALFSLKRADFFRRD